MISNRGGVGAASSLLPGNAIDWPVYAGPTTRGIFKVHLTQVVPRKPARYTRFRFGGITGRRSRPASFMEVASTKLRVKRGDGTSSVLHCISRAKFTMGCRRAKAVVHTHMVPFASDAHPSRDPHI